VRKPTVAGEGLRAADCLRVAIISRVKRNPYVDLLCEGLRQPDLALAPEVVDGFSLGWVWRERRRVDVVHIHWAELLFVYPSLARSLKRWVSVMLGVLLARLAGIRLIYTVHNLQQHEGQRPTLARLGNAVLFALAQGVHVHDQDTADLLARRWHRRRGVRVIPHGNYATVYPNTVTREAARERLGIAPEAFVYLFLGRIRPYKGVEDLIAAFRTMPDPDAVLLIAGELHEPGYDQQIRQLAGDDGRVRLHLRFVAEDDLQVYFNSCDVVVLPYRHVTTSGAAFLAFTFGVPIIAPALGSFLALASPAGERGILYDADLAEGLTAALGDARGRDLSAMRRACVAYMEQLDWRVIARQHATLYRGDLAHGAASGAHYQDKEG
jgi:beta-1,4-mannosyltransferase